MNQLINFIHKYIFNEGNNTFEQIIVLPLLLLILILLIIKFSFS